LRPVRINFNSKRGGGLPAPTGRRFIPEQCHTISVVIPALNEERRIGACVSGALHSSHVCEVIVVDGGSNDRTASIASKAGAAVLVHELPYSCGGGRGGQIRAGVARAAGDVVAVLHADTTIEPKLFRRMVQVLNSRPSAIGGAVGCRFKPLSDMEWVSTGEKVAGGSAAREGTDSGKLRDLCLQFKLGIIEFLNDFRAVFFKISFGDQVQFFRRKPVVKYDLFPDMPLMEDVEFSIRLNSIGQQVFLCGRAMVSARRWERLGSKNSAMILWLFTSYLVRRSCKIFSMTKRLNGAPDTAPFYKKYYHQNGCV